MHISFQGQPADKFLECVLFGENPAQKAKIFGFIDRDFFINWTKNVYEINQLNKKKQKYLHFDVKFYKNAPKTIRRNHGEFHAR